MWFKRKTNIAFTPKVFGSYLVKAVSLDEWQDFRAFYLRMLKEQPTCSPDSYEEMRDLPPEHWKALIERALTEPGSLLTAVVYKPTGAYVGLAHVQGHPEPKRAHEAEVRISVMATQHDEGELGQIVWQQIISHLAEHSGLKKIKVAVHTNDREAIIVFNALGFRRYGYDDSYFHIGKKYLDAVLMAKLL
jgi:RimJ/RimL family protein N-acetyltransferase